jgi:hypothetical protein
MEQESDTGAVAHIILEYLSSEMHKSFSEVTTLNTLTKRWGCILSDCTPLIEGQPHNTGILAVEELSLQTLGRAADVFMWMWAQKDNETLPALPDFWQKNPYEIQRLLLFAIQNDLDTIARNHASEAVLDKEKRTHNLTLLQKTLSLVFHSSPKIEYR